MLRCRDILEQADGYVAEELTQWRRVQVRLHLAICRHCRRYVRQLKLTQRLSKQPILTVQTTEKQIDDIWARLQQQDK